MQTPTPRAFARVADLLNDQGAKKHGDSWMSRDDRIDMSHAEVHKVHYFNIGGEWPDHDCETGELHLVHMIARLMLVLERRLMQDGH